MLASVQETAPTIAPFSERILKSNFYSRYFHCDASQSNRMAAKLAIIAKIAFANLLLIPLAGIAGAVWNGVQTCSSEEFAAAAIEDLKAAFPLLAFGAAGLTGNRIVRWLAALGGIVSISLRENKVTQVAACQTQPETMRDADCQTEQPQSSAPAPKITEQGPGPSAPATNPILEMTRSAYEKAERRLAETIYLKANIYALYSEDYIPAWGCDGCHIAQKLKNLSKGPNLDPNLKKEIDETCSLLIQQQEEVNRCRVLYHNSRGNGPPFNLYLKLADYREAYAQRLASIERGLIELIGKINERFADWRLYQNLHCPSIPRAARRCADVISHLHTISKGMPPDEQSYLSLMSSAVASLQKDWDVYRFADAHILKFPKGKAPPDIEEKIRKPQPDYYIELPPNLEEIESSYRRDDEQLKDTIFFEAFHWMVWLELNIDIKELHGKRVAEILNENSSRADLEYVQIIQNISIKLIDQQDAVDRCQKQYIQAGGGASSPFDLYAKLAHYRDFYAENIAGLEFMLLQHMLHLNQAIKELSSQGIQYPLLPYSFPLNGEVIVDKISTIMENHQLCEETKQGLENMSSSAKNCQKGISVFRRIDQLILNYPKGKASPEIEERIRRPQPECFIDYPKAISAVEIEIVTAVYKINTFLSGTIKEAPEISAKLKTQIPLIPFAYPLNVKVITPRLETFKYALKDTKDPRLESYITELDGFLAELSQHQSVFSLLANLTGTPFFPYTSSCVDRQVYEKIFYQGPIPEELSIEQRMENALKLTLKDETIPRDKPEKYREFKTKVVEAIRKKKPNNDPLYYFGTGIKTDEELKRAMRNLSGCIHPDKNGNSEESTALFKCMSELYEIALQSFTK